ncbi:hypothetical protein MLD38_023497 [Melastoma candidum]|uniref:Uncharacterized protein n=1 Tax=Melastoma candidum TaxID=119954 RepID=A0ACB9NQD0_9MYRT|nr:hypothetical protein MLD38_023497 [Melastoma candidum]
MGKQGPCCHCGVISTPLWRNGPPEKPVLCNACGSRWRTKGSLVNYTPLHCRIESVIHEEREFSEVRSMSSNKDKDVKLHNRKQNDHGMVTREVDSVRKYQKVIGEELSNRSSSGSAISDSDAQFESADVSDLTGPVQPVLWESVVPSWQRTAGNRSKQSSVEKLTKDLRTILQEQQSSCFSGTSDDDLLLESQIPAGSMEIGHGTILIRQQSKAAQEDESEASSLCINKASKSSLLSTPVLKTDKTRHLSGQGARLNNSSCWKISSHTPEFKEKLSPEEHSEDFKAIMTAQGHQISPAESIIAGDPAKNPVGGKRICETEDQKVSVNMMIKSPKRYKISLENKEPAKGGTLLMDSFAAADDIAEQDLLFDIPCNSSFQRQSFFAQPSVLDPNKLATSLRKLLSPPLAGVLIQKSLIRHN